MKVSIVIPARNEEEYLDECLRSALDQTYSDTEVIAVDDGSTDSSAEVLDGYADRVRVFHKPNGGTASALNYGRSRMRGDWFKWLNADDALKPHAIEALAGAAHTSGRPGDCMFYARCDFVDERGEIAFRLANREPDNSKTDFERNAILLHHFYGNSVTSMFHRSIFGRCGPFDESAGLAVDYEFWLRCCLLHGCKVHLVQDNIGFCRVRQSQPPRMHVNKDGTGICRARAMVLARLPHDVRKQYVDAAARVSAPSFRMHKIKAAAYNALYACLPEPAARGALSAYHRIRG